MSIRAAMLSWLAVPFVLAVWGTARTAGARETRSRVAVVRSASNDPLLREASTRLRAELVAAGFEVVEVDRIPGDGRSEVESSPSTGGGGSAGSASDESFATVAMTRAGAGALADVWIGDHVTGKTVVQTLRVGAAPNAAAVLAIRALELLRASLLEVAAAPRASEAPLDTPKDVLKWVEPSLPDHAPPPADLFEGGALGVGAIALHGLRGIGLALGPTLRVSHGIAAPWFGRLTLTGPLIGPSLEEKEGTATVRQEFASLDLGLSTRQAPLGFFAWAGAGAYHLHTSGSATAPFRSTSDDVFSFLLTAGIGGVARVARRLAVTADLSAIGVVPRPVVIVSNRAVGSAGGPSLGMSLGLVVGL